MLKPATLSCTFLTIREESNQIVSFVSLQIFERGFRWLDVKKNCRGYADDICANSQKVISCHLHHMQIEKSTLSSSSISYFFDENRMKKICSARNFGEFGVTHH